MKKLLMAILLLTSIEIKAEPFGSNVNQKGWYSKAKNAGCELTYIDQTLAVTTLTTPLSLYWLAISSPQIPFSGGAFPGVPDENTYAYIESSTSTAINAGLQTLVLNNLAKVGISSGTNTTYFEFNPPIISSQTTLLKLTSTTLSGAFCYQYKSTSPYTRVNEPVDFNDQVVDVEDAGCSVTSAFATGASLISTNSANAFPPPSSNRGTIVYWIYASSAPQAGVSLLLRSTDTANTSSTLAIPPLSFNQPSPIFNLSNQKGFDGRMIRFNPPFFVPDRISYNIGVALQQGVKICSRGISENTR